MPVKIENVLVCDAVDKACTELLESHGIKISYKLKLTSSELCEEIKKVDGVIVRSDTKITESVIKAANGNLKVIGRAGVGIDNIDLSAATQSKVIVLNSPGGNTISACELTCLLIGALARPIVPAGESMKQDRWDRKLYSGNELHGKTLAILGLGRIGREVGIRMKAWGMNIIGYDPITTEEEAKASGIKKLSLDEIWPIADYITVHTPLIPATKNMVNSETIKKCKKGFKIVNVARGGIIDEQAILDALQTGICNGAAFDVYPEEPPKSALTKALIKHPKVVATPHLGASTSEAQVRVAIEVAEQFIALTEKSDKYTTYSGVVNKDILKNYSLH